MKDRKSTRTRKQIAEITRSIGDPMASPITPAKEVVLRPAGYPLEINASIGTPALRIRDEKLFTAYCVDQWQGIKVKCHDYLFDQLLLPDFAFEVVEVTPPEAHIVSDTRVRLIQAKEFKPSRGRKILFDDVIGHESAKIKCLIIKKYMEDPQGFAEWAPRKVLFYGSPGTGKTMMAKALAWETQVEFYYVKATALIGQHVGAGADKVHRLFEDATSRGPCIVFIDEIDSIGLDRSFQSVRGDVTEIVNSLISELDLIEERNRIVVIAATNTREMLDTALRSRFEEEIEFPNPSYEERLKILEKYASTLPLPLTADLKAIAKRTDGFSGRDLKERVLKGALHYALSNNLSEIDDSAFKRVAVTDSAQDRRYYI